MLDNRNNFNHEKVSLLARRYPQLLLPIQTGIKDTPEYKDAVLRGKPVFREAEFIGSAQDMLTVEPTPAGEVEILFLAHREDFEHVLRALAYRCEPVEIPASVGASTISGLINWEKIHTYESEYRAAGGCNWTAELKRFTSDKANYLDNLILLSYGEYSGVPAAVVGLDSAEWKEKSLTIRKNHELTHFVCRKLYPEDINAVRDEVIADCIGLIAAFGEYDTYLASLFLGVQGDQFQDGGRLAHYVLKAQLNEAMEWVKGLIDACHMLTREMKDLDQWQLITHLMENIR